MNNLIHSKIFPTRYDIGKSVFTEYGVCILLGITDDNKYIILLPDYKGTKIVENACLMT